MKLLLVVRQYPPDISVSARRWGNLVQGLQKEGFSCAIICAGDSNNYEHIGFAGERVIRVSLINQAHSEDTIIKKVKQEKRIKNLFRNLFFMVCPPIFRDFSVRSWIKSYSLSTIIDVVQNSDCIISSYGPAAPFLFGWWLSKKERKPWIADIRDSFESRDGVVSPFSRKISRFIERFILRQASLRLTVGMNLAKYLSCSYQTEFHAIYNGWADDDRIKRLVQQPHISPYLYYAGSIYTNRTLPALTLLLRAMKHHQEIKLKVRLLKDYTNGEFSQIINREGREIQIEILPPVSSEIVNHELAQSIGALVLEDISGTSALNNGTVTGKLIGLLASGVPGIAVCSEKSEIRYLVDKVNGWHAADTIQQCQTALEALKLQNSSSPNIEPLDEYSIVNQSKNFANLIRQFIKKHQAAKNHNT